MSSPRAWIAFAFATALFACVPPRRDVAPDAPLAAAVRDLDAFVRQEIADKGIPGVTIALADGKQVVWADGFGVADVDAGTPARAGTIHRVGSVAKLFTDVAVMQLVEAGELDLDQPVTEYLTDFAPRSAWSTPITLRHLLTHRAGLVREPPVGNYFSDDKASLAATVASLNNTELVAEPGTRFKYSNAGVAVAGRVLEVVGKERFEARIERVILTPLQLRDSSFRQNPSQRGRMAKGRMWTYDGREFAAPEFELGIGPAANLRATAPDLVRFAQSWFLHLSAVPPRLLREETWQAMFTPSPDAPFLGLGFFVDRLDGHQRVGHNGAMYGFATELAALPEEGLAVAVIANMDFANAVPQRIADRALRWLLARREGRVLAAAPAPVPVGAARAQQLAGLYRSGPVRVRLHAVGDELWLEPPAGLRMRLRAAGDARGERFVADDRAGFGVEVRIGEQQLEWRGVSLARTAEPKPDPVPAPWRDLIGEYGWDHDTLYVLEKDGELRLLIEWFAEYPLREVGTDRFVLPDQGLYAAEPVTFVRRGGVPSEVLVGGVRFPRRVLPSDRMPFRIKPMLPLDELRVRAFAAEPPPQPGNLRRPDLVELVTLDPTLRLDVRYATTNNFLGLEAYAEARAFLQRPAAEALVRVQRALARDGYGLIVHDGYRPWFVTKMFWDGTPPELHLFVADPSRGSRHNRGCAVDLTLCDLASGAPADMVSLYDEFTPRAFPRYPGGTSLQRWHRERLRAAMAAEGFAVDESEWWHFDYRDWREYPILNTAMR